jgi:hypothetical protein
MSALKKQVKTLFYTFRTNKQSPLDDRIQVASLSTIATELPVSERYQGMIFWVKDIETFYCFETDLTVPVNFRASIVSSDTKGILYPSQSYSTLLSDLTALSPSMNIGSVVGIFPLGVSYKFDGTNWLYAYGDYSADTLIHFDTIDNSLLVAGRRAIIGGAIRVINADFSLSPEVTIVSVAPVSPENDRYYLVNGILYYSIGGGFYKIGGKVFVAAGTELIAGDTNITHGLNSPYVRGMLWISELNELCALSLKYVDANNSSINSRVDVTGTLLIVADN